MRRREDSDLYALRALALAYLGRHAEAVREGERAVALGHVSQHASGDPYAQQLLARIYLRTGKTERALDLVEELLRVPSDISPGRLRIDPDFAPLEDHPRFRKLVGGTPGATPAASAPVRSSP